MSGYNERIVRATRQVLLEVFQLLDKFQDSLVLIGGWVPIMIIPDVADKHVSTIDVDLAINDRTLLETVRKRWKRFYYPTDINMVQNRADILGK